MENPNKNRAQELQIGLANRQQDNQGSLRLNRGQTD